MAGRTITRIAIAYGAGHPRLEMSQASWLVGAMVPGVERHPLKKLGPDAEALLRLLQRWRDDCASGSPLAPYHLVPRVGQTGPPMTAGFIPGGSATPVAN